MSVPLALIVPALACGVSWWAGKGVVVARTAALTAAAAWLVCLVFIEFVA